MPNFFQIQVAATLCMVLAAAVSFFTTPLSMAVARKGGWIDIPDDERRVHKKPTPCFGGLAIFLAFSVAICVYEQVLVFANKYTWAYDSLDAVSKLNAALIAGALMFFIGALDDRFSIKWFLKLGGQFLCAAVAFFLGVKMEGFSLLGWELDATPILSFLLTVFWIVALTNMVNLIDGLDGLAAGVSGIAALAIGYSAYLNGQHVITFAMLILAGSALGFLPFNFYPAKTFMGDSGAMFLGFMLASTSIIGPTKGATLMAIVAPALVLGVPLFDVLFAIVRRTINRKHIFTPDRSHLHHQLMHIGIGQRRAALMLYAISGIMGIAAIVYTRDLFYESVGLFFIAAFFIFLLIWDWNKKDKS